MIYVEMLGRMGNQMFSYAYARYIKEMYPEQEICLDFTRFEYLDESWTDYLQYFDCSDNYSVGTRKLNILQRLVLKLFYLGKKKGIGWKETRKREDKWFNLFDRMGLYIYSVGYKKFSHTDKCRNKLLVGFFESPKYFDSIQSIIKRDFDVKCMYEKPVILDILNKIDSDTAICLGVRKWIFTGADLVNYDVCGEIYYTKAINYIKNTYNLVNTKIFVFTDDVEWVKENMVFDDEVTYVTSSLHGDIKPWEMVNIMRKFRYYIIPNSSFFWWGQYLSDYEDRVTIAPSKWRMEDSDIYADIYQDDWILIDNK